MRFFLPALFFFFSFWILLGCHHDSNTTSSVNELETPETSLTKDPSPPENTSEPESPSLPEENPTLPPVQESSPPIPHIQITEGQCLIDGQPVFLYGGELQYFRVRSENFDPETTWQLWEETLDLMAAAGMNLVTTYIPWDYHHLGPDQYDFTGARDVGRFLEMARSRGFYIVCKPGPLITGEWPRGFGTFGAVPEWWKEAHPEALIRNAEGDFFSYDLFGDERQRQPTYLHPVYLNAVQEWYTKVMEVVRPYLGNALIGIQIDNETNLYWSNRYFDVDYSETALTHYRQWLETRYDHIANLNQRYGTSYNRFEDVAPPTRRPGKAITERQKNPWYADWYWAGQAYIAEYLQTLRTMFGTLGFNEPEVLFYTNDSPFTLFLEDLQLRNVMIHDGPTKNRLGLAALDLYPKQFFSNNRLQDQPFQADYYTRLYDYYNDQYTGNQSYTYGAELQGGFYSIQNFQPHVRPEATEQLFVRTIGRGLKGGSFYVIRDGYNLDNSLYDFQAAITLGGETTARYEVFKRWGNFLAREGKALLQAEEITNDMVILNNGLYAAPQGGILDNMQRFYTIDYPALFGWLVNAGFNPVVVDTRYLSAEDLSRFKIAFYPNPDYLDESTAELLESYTRNGGTLVTTLWPGRLNENFVASPSTNYLSTQLYPALEHGYFRWTNLFANGRFNLAFNENSNRELLGFSYETLWDFPVDRTIAPFAWKREESTGENLNILGYVVNDRLPSPQIFLGTNLYSRFNTDEYYLWETSDLETTRDLARWMGSVAGVSPIIASRGLRELVWARRSSEKIYLFLLNDNTSLRTFTIDVLNAEALGLEPGSYEIRNELEDTVLYSLISPQEIISNGIRATVPYLGATVLSLQKK